MSTTAAVAVSVTIAGATVASGVSLGIGKAVVVGATVGPSVGPASVGGTSVSVATNPGVLVGTGVSVAVATTVAVPVATRGASVTPTTSGSATSILLIAANPTTPKHPHNTIPTNTVRSHTLTGLTNYVWYTVTLNAMVDAAPILTDTVRVMPTDRLLYLPVVLK